jgi:hypothetical protein
MCLIDLRLFLLGMNEISNGGSYRRGHHHKKEPEQ